VNSIMTEEELEDVAVAQVSEVDMILDGVREAVRLLDSCLDETGNRGIVSASEISDLLLDVRLVLVPLLL
jgi:hypothetical protein